MESKEALTIESQQPSKPALEARKQLIREWLARFALNADKELTPRAVEVYVSLWMEGFSDLDDAVLVAAFRKTLRACKFWPVKVADVRDHISCAVSRSTDEAAEQAWHRVLEIRRTVWNPDIPGPFDRAVARLSERVKQAARAAGVWREFTADEWEAGALHTWAKKRFCESFNSWGEREQDKFLLPEGEVKKLLIECAEKKSLLPAPKPEPAMLPEERVRVAEQLAAAARKVIEAAKKESPWKINDTPERRAELAYQAAFIKKSYPPKEKAVETLA